LPVEGTLGKGREAEGASGMSCFGGSCWAVIVPENKQTVTTAAGRACAALTIAALPIKENTGGLSGCRLLPILGC
jgi:hypothetical protein